MSNEAKAQIELILKNCEVAYSAIYRGATIRDKWECDAWVLVFTVNNAGRATNVEFDYFTGHGHRKPDDSAMARTAAHSLRKVSKRMIAWEDHYKRYPDKVVKPHPADVLYSLMLDASAINQSFNSWCSDMGMDPDSRKALATYEACQENADKLARVFDAVARKAIEEALQDY